MRGERTSGTGLPDGALWQRSRTTEAGEDEAARLLDLAGFADGLLDIDERERVAELLAGDPAAAEDIAAAQALSAAAEHLPAAPAVVARACALVPRTAAVIPFPSRRGGSVLRLPGMARWGSLAAAMAVASWLGFTLGMDTSRSIAQAGQ